MTLGDIFNLKNKEIPSMDILTAGFPCQGFSIAGKKKGFDDPRSTVFFKLIDIIKEKMPKCIVLENVKNILTHDDKKTFAVIKEELQSCGYTIKYAILNTSIVTEIPQNRERMYIVCFKNKTDSDKFSFPGACNETIELKNFLLKSAEIDDKYYYTEKLLVYKTIKEQVAKDISQNVLYQYRRHYVRENKSNVCPTLTANCGTGGHNLPLLLDNKGIRKLTPKECFKLQGFPENYKLPSTMSDSALYKLAGNAITVKISDVLAKKIVEILNE